MSTLGEIEAAVEQLPLHEKEELQAYVTEQIQRQRSKGVTKEYFEAWLQKARGAGIPGVTTDDIMRLTRGEE